MNIKVQVPVSASKEVIWKIITDIENAAQTVSGIDKVEVLEKPSDGFIGLKWMETRTLFGKTATETMWITEAKNNEFYNTRAESHGSVYLTTVSITESEGTVFLNMEFKGEAKTFGAKIMSFIFGPMIKNATKKALLQDLMDIKKAAENKN